MKDRKEYKYRVWYIPQIPGEPFYFFVASPENACNIISLLIGFSNFEYEQHIKPDYSDVFGLEVCENGQWTEWSSEETGNSIDEFMDEEDYDPFDFDYKRSKNE